MSLSTDVAAAAVVAVNDSAEVPPGMSYGTAGFRSHERNLDGIFLRMGMLAVLRAIQVGKGVGVMITASHNPVEDNGVKMIDTDGGMLARSWEKYACDLAAARKPEVVNVLNSVVAQESIGLAGGVTAIVYIARDTRPSSDRLAAQVTRGVQALGGKVIDCGLLTTPQLHHIVRMANQPPVIPAGVASSCSPVASYAGEEGYYRMLADGYRAVLDGQSADTAARGPLLVDCANGVGGVKGAILQQHVAQYVTMQLRNTGQTPEEAALLNEGVGAEHAQKARLPPAGFDAVADAGLRCASLDGDADRIVYHYFSKGDGQWHLIDGDKIACLAAAFIGKQLQQAGLQVTGEATHPHDSHHASPASASVSLRSSPVSVGIVQTAYANGASSNYIRETLKLPVVLAKTGVKFVHHAAQEFDIGVYFEANGHGTVIFHSSFVDKLVAVLDKPQAEVEAEYGVAGAQALRRLFFTTLLVNQAIGDALSDSLFAEAVLTIQHWSVADWDAMYTDLPSRQSKLAVKDRNAIKTTSDETRVVTPAALQEAIDALVAAVPAGRAFVRPSGTEDVVRVYAEAATQAEADQLAAQVADAAKRLAGGI